MTDFSEPPTPPAAPSSDCPADAGRIGAAASGGAERGRLTTLEALAEAGLLPPESLPDLAAVSRRYAIGLTPALARLIDRNDPYDPIARQFVPDLRELRHDPAETADPIGDDARSPIDGLVHRYPDRVLIKLVAVCAVYCRFCFRREGVGPRSGRLGAEAFRAALDYVRARPEIWEVILTGGDPLTLSPRRVAEAGAAIASIGHVATIRWHTRLPVAAPERVTPALVRALARPDKTVVVAVHANHPRELTAEVRAACRRLTESGLLLVSQTVLLKGVNDDVDILDALMRALVEARIKPYYLHHGDLAPGTAHWRTSIAEGQALMRGLRARLSGLALPTYVLDIPGGWGKVPIEGPSIRADGNGGYWVTGPGGVERPYRDRLA